MAVKCGARAAHAMKATLAKIDAPGIARSVDDLDNSVYGFSSAKTVLTKSFSETENKWLLYKLLFITF